MLIKVYGSKLTSNFLEKKNKGNSKILYQSLSYQMKPGKASVSLHVAIKTGLF